MTDSTPVSQTTRPGNALRAAGIAPASPWEFLARRGQKITPEIAEALATATATGTSPKFWTNMQEAFDG